MKYFLTIFLFLIALSSSTHGQKGKTVSGRVHDRFTLKPIPDVQIYTKDSVFTSISDDKGEYEITLKRRTNKLYFFHPDYYPMNSRWRTPTRSYDVRMNPKKRKKPVYGKPSGNNAIAFLPTKFILGALGLRYERFFKTRYSVGLYFDWYYHGRQIFGSEVYTGFKATPTFRYFFVRHEALGFYIQASALLGYFDFSKLNYVDPYKGEDVVSIEYYFWTGGFGYAVGSYFAVGNNKHTYIDINIGFQYLPVSYPTEYDNSPKGTYEHNPTWWYIGGPGSFVEFKFALGGIF